MRTFRLGYFTERLSFPEPCNKLHQWDVSVRAAGSLLLLSCGEYDAWEKSTLKRTGSRLELCPFFKTLLPCAHGSQLMRLSFYAERVRVLKILSVKKREGY